jgi:hypothetical protein
MKVPVAAVHFALKGGVDRALLLYAVFAFEGRVNHFGGEMRAIVSLYGDLAVREGVAQKRFDFRCGNRHVLILLLILNVGAQVPCGKV